MEEALDQPQWVFNQGADSKQWFGQSIATHDQTDAVQSPLLDHLESVSFSTQLDGPGILRFFWKVSSEADYDFLECWVDDVLMHSLSGEVDWQEAKVTLTEGSHEVRWVYRKDEWLSVGQDTAWVDQIHFEALSKLVLLKAPESVVSTEGESVTFRWKPVGNPRWPTSGIGTKPRLQVLNPQVIPLPRLPRTTKVITRWKLPAGRIRS